VNVNLVSRPLVRMVVSVTASLGGVVLMTACGAQGDDEATDEALSADASDVEIFAYAYASGKDPQPTWELENQVVVFTFPSGSVDANSDFDCLIAVNVFAQDHPDWDLKMAYPDGSVLCSELDL
jgi:hypothetical protein